MSAETTTCSWCSATVPVAAATCPSCGAALQHAGDVDIAGVTQLDPASVLQTKRAKGRGIAAWLVGERESLEPTTGKVEPPSEEVRREMLRLKLAAIDAELEATAAAAAAARELGIDDTAPGPDPGTEAEPGAEPESGAGPAKDEPA